MISRRRQEYRAFARASTGRARLPKDLRDHLDLLARQEKITGVVPRSDDLARALAPWRKPPPWVL